MSHQLLCFLSLLSLAVGQMTNLRFSKVLNPQGTFVVQWDFNKATEAITIQIEAPTLGWVGFGLSPSGGMAGADIVIGGVMSNQTTYFGDYHALGEFRPILDTIQNHRLLSVTENATSTTMRFIRQFRTCDPFDVDVTANTQRIIAAYGTTDTLAYHGPNQRFQASVQLLSETPVPPPDPVPSFTHELRMNNYPVPSADTTYACAYLQLPQVSVKNHMYRFESVIQSGNEDLVHHILIYGCPNNTNVSIPPGICMNNTEFFPCRQVVYGWAVGGGSFTLPSNAGMSLGTNLDPQYIRIEVHYNNPSMQSGRIDSSGFRIHYTPVLRPLDAGVLAIGTNVEGLAFIPPRADSFKLSAYCKTEKFSQVISEPIPDMQVIATLLHSHLAGRAIQVGHYRDGKQIGFVGRDMSYDFSLQETRYLAEITPIKVGDELQTECTYNTTERPSVTYGGLSTTSEMCLAFLFYTPRNLIAECTSNPDYRSLSSPFGFDVHSNPAALNLVSWTPENISLAQRVTQESTQNIRVIHFNASFILDTGLIRDITPPPVTPCNSSETSTTAPTSMPNMPNTVPHCHSGQSLSSGYLCLTPFLLSTLSVILSPFLDF